MLDLSVNHWNEYVTSLKASDKITIKDVTYSIDNITMVHQETSKGLVVELHVKLNR